MNECACHEQIAIPLLISRHDIPGRFIRTALGERLLIGLLIIVPVFPLSPISSRDFPCVRLILLLGQEASFLLVVAHMQVELQNNHVMLNQQALKVVNGCVVATPGFLWHQVMYAHDQHVLIVGAIENAKDTSAWSDPMHTPEEVMVPFPSCRDFKRTHLASLRIDSGEDLVNRISLATGIHPLQHDE